MSENTRLFASTDEGVVAKDSIVTEKDVVAALAEAEHKTASYTVAPSNVTEVSTEEKVSNFEEQVVNQVLSRRNDQVQHFQLDISLDDIPDADGMKDDTIKSDAVSAEIEILSESVDEKNADDGDVDKPVSSRGGCFSKIIFTLIVLAISALLATAICKFIFGATGWNGNEKSVIVVIPEGANTLSIAETLKENKLIDDVWCFRVYSRLVKADGKWHAGKYVLQSDMGFSTMVETLQVPPVRESVTVMLREGLTIDEMSTMLEDKGVCTKKEFLDALVNEEYDYDFVKQIPTDGENTQRVYRLEGYLFPDTYDFYTGSTGREVVEKMLDNFQDKLTPSLINKIEKMGWSIDEAITFASMVQGEGDTRENMGKVSRVLHNRLDPDSGFKKLELCCTRDYANEMLENHGLSSDELHAVYNTYKREGFPIGPIGNPGMDALLAALNPSEDAEIMKCYYFATDYKTGITYFSKTYREHQATIDKYGIEDLG